MTITPAQRMRKLNNEDYEKEINNMNIDQLYDEYNYLKKKKEELDNAKDERSDMIENRIDDPAFEHLIDMAIVNTPKDFELAEVNSRLIKVKNRIDKLNEK